MNSYQIWQAHGSLYVENCFKRIVLKAMGRIKKKKIRNVTR